MTPGRFSGWKPRNAITASILGYAGQAVPERPGVFVPENPHHHVDAEADAAATATPTAEA